MVFNSGRSHNSKVLNLGRVILVVSIPSFSSASNPSNTSAIISSNCPQLRTSISSRLCKCSSNLAGSSFFILEQFPISLEIYDILCLFCLTVKCRLSTFFPVMKEGSSAKQYDYPGKRGESVNVSTCSLESDCLGLNDNAATGWLCDLGQVN